MEVTTHQALLGFSLDLTDPHAAVLPVGMIMVGEADDFRFAAAAAVEVSEEIESLDPISQEFLKDVPELIEEQLGELIESDCDSSPRELLLSLHNMLRNSLHVMEMDEEAQTIEISAEQGLSSVLVDRLLRRLHQEINEFRAAREERGTSHSDGVGEPTFLPERTRFLPFDKPNRPSVSLG